MKAATYARVSSEKQDVDLSVSAQNKALKEYADRNGHDVVMEFVDEAESGKTADRPAFRRMISMARRLIQTLRPYPSLEVLPIRSEPSGFHRVQDLAAQERSSGYLHF